MALIRIKRGPQATLPTLEVGELGFTTDTHRVYVGSSAGNVMLNQSNVLLGIESTMPALLDGQLYYATDTEALWIGSAGVNIETSGNGLATRKRAMATVFAFSRKG